MVSARGALPLVLVVGACASLTLEGEVVDVDGAALVDAQVSLVGAPVLVRSGEDGRFSLPYEPGSLAVRISKEGYDSLELPLGGDGSPLLDLGRRVLVRTPEQKGLYLRTPDTYAALVPSRLTLTTAEPKQGRVRSWCLDPASSTPNRTRAGVVTLHDFDASPWRPFRLDEEHCAYRDVMQSGGRWKVLYRERATSDEEEVGPGRKVAHLDLVAGDYFVADWGAGFFTPAGDGQEGYSGAWLQVEE